MTRTSTLRRLVLPVFVLMLAALSGLAIFAGGSSGAADPTTTEVIAADSASQANAQIVISPAPTPSSTGKAPKVAYQTTVANAGTPNSSIRIFKDGSLATYGNRDVTYWTPSKDRIPLGQALYQQNCASCHGNSADGIPANGTDGAYPNLRGLGSATIDFWIESGRMPAANPRDVQAVRKPPRLTHDQALAVVAYVNSLSPATPYIPRVNSLDSADVADGFALFALNCAACHTITGGGDALANNTYAPSLRHISATQVAEAIRTGPGNMPRFTGNLTDAQLRNVVGYVTTGIQHPTNPGGFGLGGLGPVAEGFIALLLGVGVLALVGFWIGDRT